MTVPFAPMDIEGEEGEDVDPEIVVADIGQFPATSFVAD